MSLASSDLPCFIAVLYAQSVLVHQLSRFATQNPFRKNRGRVMRVAFHPAKPFFFVATQNAVRIYNLAKQVSSSELLVGVCLASTFFWADMQEWSSSRGKCSCALVAPLLGPRHKCSSAVAAAVRLGPGHEHRGETLPAINLLLLLLLLQALAKKLLGGSGVISSMAIHPSGDHVILGSEDKRLAW
jgi:hypothetical protein